MVKSLSMLLPHLEEKAACRHLVLEAVFDGLATVWCPLGDFFGTGAGVVQNEDFYRSVQCGGSWTCRWPMPYRQSARISVRNLGGEDFEINLTAETVERPWTDRSMHFYARWRFEHPIPTRPMKDWNYIEVNGKGVFVGDTLSVINPVSNWWGEGDEKIYVDGEKFPSHFGTGTEDYYGYAWCCPVPFQAPFHGQPRCDGHPHDNNWGHTTVSRVRALDAIPFTRSFRLDMEVWHWKECEVGYGAAAFFYALPGADHNRPPLPDAAKAPVPVPPPLPPPFRIEGALECEAMKVLAKREELPVTTQNMKSFGPKISSGDAHLWIQGREPGDFVELEVPLEGGGAHRVLLYATRSWDYGIVRFFINGRRAGEDVDLFNEEARAVAATGPIDLGVHEAMEGHLKLKVEVVGGNPRSEGSKSFFGLDCVVLVPAE
jgi:hypothetical protein